MNEKGAVSRALLVVLRVRGRLARCGADCQEAGAELHGGLRVAGLESRARDATDVVVGGGAAVFGVLDAVAGVRVHRDALDVRADTRSGSAKSRTGQAGVVAVLDVELLRRRNGRADVRLRSRRLRAALEAQVRGHRNSDEDAENDDDDQKLDEGEALLRAQPRLNAIKHSAGSPSTREWGYGMRCPLPHRR